MFSLIGYKDNYSSLISHIEYGNGTEIMRFYDDYDRLVGEMVGENMVKTYTYDSYNRVLSYTDHLTGITESYTYDLVGDKGTVLLSPFFIDIIHLLCYSKLG